MERDPIPTAPAVVAGPSQLDLLKALGDNTRYAVMT